MNWNMLYNFKSHFDRCIQLAVVVVHLITYILGTIILKHTSSTAQGGGGSFKNRKPIGEVGCCESEMAERIH